MSMLSRSASNVSAVLLGIVPALLLVCAPSAAKERFAAEYRLQAGDVLEIVVAGMPDLKQRIAVQVDGGISMPLVGTILVAGSSLAETRAKIQAALATKVFRHIGPDGRERPVVVKYDEVSASIVEYCPIYIQGEVMKPGQLTFRPHMTVRQAVGAAGGYYALRFQTLSIAKDAIDMQGDYAALWVTFAKEQLAIARLTAELDGVSARIDDSVLSGVPLPAPTLAKISQDEEEIRALRAIDLEKERTFLQRSIGQVDRHIVTLEEQQKKEDEGIKQDTADLQRLTRLFERGNIAIPRLTESRRALLLSTTKQVQTRSEIISAERRRGELERQLDKLPDERRITTLQELQKARLSLATTRAKLQTLAQQLPNAMKQIAGVKETKTPKFVVYRSSHQGEHSFIGDGDTELQPGDVVEVLMQPGPTKSARSIIE